MKQGITPNEGSFLSKNAHLLGASPFDRLRQGKTLEQAQFFKFLDEIKSKLNEGFAIEAEERAFEILENYQHSIDAQAQLNQILSAALEMQGFFEDALKAVQPFEEPSVRAELSEETDALILAQLGTAYLNFNDSDKATELLKAALKIAEDRDFTYLLIKIYLGLARLQRELYSYSVSRNYADQALKLARELGDRQSFAETYRMIATSYQREGNQPKALDNFQQAIQLVGERSAPYPVGKIYLGMSAACAALQRPSEGLDYAQKSVKAFEKIGNKFELVIARHHFGVNLRLSGDWKKAEEIFNQALDLAFETKHPFLVVILASLGELEFLRGETEKAEKILTKALDFATIAKKDWSRIPVFYHLARCLLAQGEADAAISQAETVIETAINIKENYFSKLAELVLAEAYLKKRKVNRTDEILKNIEADEASENYLALGYAARIRALMAKAVPDDDLMLHHYNRSLSIFEMAGDQFHSAVINYEIGKNFINQQPLQAIKNLEKAAEIFKKLEATRRFKLAEEILLKVNKREVVVKREQALSLQLLMLRLVEAVSSRELLFRELVKILRENSKAKKTMLSELKEGRKFQPWIIDGFVPTESVELAVKINDAFRENDLENFAREKNIQLLHLRAPNATPALLVIAPAAGAILTDGSPIQPLLQVTELGMEVCALREIAKDRPLPNDSSVFVTHSLMPGFIHSSPPMNEVVDEILKIRNSDINVLITGESGTGKELIARAVHYVSARKDKVFVPFNCTAVPKELTEGHLFGYKKGAFTGATTDSDGMIRSADGGTLFLDEIGDLPLDVQPKILRFLQEGEVQPLGEKAPKKVDVRIVTATNMNLEEMVMQGLFREDLYFRLNVIRLRIPPLRERRSEIPQLVNHFLSVYSAKFGRKNLTMSSEALDLLIAHNWKGNVRQLCNEVQRIVARSDDGDKITPRHLSEDIKPTEDAASENSSNTVKTIGLTSGAINIQTQGVTLEEAVSALEIQMITESLNRHEHNISRVAKELNLTRRGLYLKLDRYKMR
jgi:DNA-binding NtrC family response regulator/tetratricopeptide (TPR) repeat protein